MAVQSEIFSTEYGVRSFISTKHIATKQNMAVWLQRVSDDVWIQLSQSNYELINNSAVLTTAPNLATYSKVEIRVADTPDELGSSQSEISIIADNIGSINIVAENITDINDVSDSIENVNIIASYTDNIDINANNIDDINVTAEAIRGGGTVYDTIKLSYSIDTVDDFTSVPEVYTTAIVKDSDRGGIFHWSATGVANGGTVFAGATGYWNRQYSGAVNVKWFGAKGDGVADDTVAFNDTILFAAINNIGKVEVPTDYYKLLGTIVCPGNLIIDFMNSTLYGNGIGAANDLFQSGYYENGAIHTTIGLPDETRLCTKLILTNATIINTGKALNLHNCNWQCEFSNLQFFNCTYAIYADSCFYGRFVNLISRGPANNATNAAFYFERAVNVEQMESIFVTERILGIEITEGSNGLGLYNCSAESNSTGVLISSDTGPITFNSCYFELNTVCGVDINTNYNKFGIAFLGCFFNANINDAHTCIALKLNQTGIIGQSNVLVDMSNRFYDNDIDIDDSNNSAYSTSKIDYHTTPIGDNTLPSINSRVKLGKFTNSNIIQNYVTYLGDRKSYVTGNTIIPFNYCGTAGENTYNMHAFITKTLSGSGASVIATFDTELICSGSGIFVYHITGYDTQTAYRFYGLVYGTSSTSAILHPLYTSSGKTITLNVVNNRLQFVLGNFNAVFLDQTTIRHM